MKKGGFLNLTPKELEDHLEMATKDMEPSEAAYVKLINRQFEKEEEVRKNKPHVALVEFNIKIHPMSADGTLDPPVKNIELTKMGMNEGGVLQVRGASFVETAKKLDKLLKELNEKY
jgi:hypothetical protein